MMRTRWLGVLAAVLVTGTAHADDDEANEPEAEAEHALATPRVMTLREATEYARTHQPAILAAVARVNAAKESAQIPRSQWLPRFGITAQVFAATENNTTASTVATMPEIDVPRIGGTRTVDPGGASWSPYASTFLAAGGTQEIFDFGRIAAESAASDAKVDIAKKDVLVRTIDVEFGVQEAYFAVYAAKGVLASAEGAYTRAKEHQGLAQAGVTSGLRSPIELTRATADLARYDVGRMRSRGNVQLAQSVLAAAMGAPDIAIDVSSEQPPIEALPTLQQALADAHKKSPWLASAIARLTQQEHQTKAIRAEMRPNLQFSATITGRAGGAPPTSGPSFAGGWVPGVPNYDVALLLSWPLFDGTINARANASREMEAAHKAQIDATRVALDAAVDRAYIRAVVAREALPALQRALTGAVSNYAQAQARFGAGLGNAVELADAETLRTDAEIQLALGVFDVARARAALGRALAGGAGMTTIPTSTTELTTPTRAGISRE